MDNNFSLNPPDYSKVAVIEARLANLAQTAGPGWNQLLTAKDMAATRTMQEQVLWMHRLASTFWTIQIHSCLHIPFINSRPESKAVCLENARSLMFLYECIRAQFTSPGIRNVVAFYGFASAVFLETVSNLPADKKRVERMKEILDEDAQKSPLLPLLKASGLTVRYNRLPSFPSPRVPPQRVSQNHRSSPRSPQTPTHHPPVLWRCPYRRHENQHSAHPRNRLQSQTTDRGVAPASADSHDATGARRLLCYEYGECRGGGELYGSAAAAAAVWRFRAV